jgi:hypothetical protein
LFYRACDEKRQNMESLLGSFLEFKEDLLRIPRAAGRDAVEPAWANPMFPPLDAIALYGMVSRLRPRLYLEIGVGHSTRFARRAIRDHSLGTSITCIDPAPGISVDGVADTILPMRLEDVDPAVFSNLHAGDILFVDSSHRVFMNSDATVLLLDVLPTLRPGVIVHFHDIHLPHDYPPDWGSLYYNEQYLLAAYILGGNRLEILLANAFITRDAALHGVLNPIWNASEWNGLPTYGASFWARVS